MVNWRIEAMAILDCAMAVPAEAIFTMMAPI